ncbi:hypothetical protein LX64_00991 [Chitinophaga skermanii]|uniref:GLPGLI family protein n=1 Tax=Chitinophaga skermanii TaxID=331697 RepID=A0A327QY50_9BACT|nr:hypothetical protein [Chitinophaga skermanii]RAJ08343.1 hypothetical protein LX64_00991 [Chitinophaga skermanii]
MKQILLAATCSFMSIVLHAQSTSPGYIVTTSNDTLAVQIKMKRNVFGQVTNNYTDEVEVVDSVKGTIKYLPGDIHAYGIVREDHKLMFVSKPTTSGEQKFLYPMYVGPKSSLYAYGIFTSGGGYAMPNKQVFYTFEKAGGIFLCLKNIVNKKFKAQVKAFYQDSPAVMEIIDSKLKYWLELDKDLLVILKKANE